MALIVAAGALLRFVGLERDSFWQDETLCYYNAVADFSTTIDTLSRENQPPLYHFALHGWMSLLGHGHFALRALPALVGVLAILLAFGLGRELSDEKTALSLAFVVALSSTAVWFSREATMYSTLVALTIGVGWAFARWLRDGSWKAWGAMTLVKCAGLYVHYFFGFGFLAEGAYLLIRRRERTVWLRWLLSHLVVVIVFAPWLPILHKQMSRVSGDFHLPSLRLLDPANAVRQWILWVPELDHDGWRWLIPLGVVVFLLLACIGLWRAWRERRDLFWLAVCWIIVPMVAVAALSLRRTIFAPKYLMGSSIWLFALAAYGGMSLRKTWMRATALSLIAVVGLCGIGLRVFNQGYRGRDYRAACDLIEKRRRDRDIVLVGDAPSLAISAYYLSQTTPPTPDADGLYYCSSDGSRPPFWQGVEMFDDSTFVSESTAMNIVGNGIHAIGQPLGRTWFMLLVDNMKSWETHTDPAYPINRSGFLSIFDESPERWDFPGVVVLLYD